MGKLRFLIFASLLAIIFGLLVVGDSPTMATEKRAAYGFSNRLPYR